MTFSENIIGVRDLIARYEELEDELSDLDENSDNYTQGQEEDTIEFTEIKDILSDLAGYGGDEQWRGDWYPVTLIHEDYFTEYCEDLIKDIGDLPRNIPRYIEIDWESTAENIKQDYSYIEIDGKKYYYR